MFIDQELFTSNPRSYNYTPSVYPVVETTSFVSSSSWDMVASPNMARRQSFDSMTADERCFSRNNFAPQYYVTEDYASTISENCVAYSEYQQPCVSFSVDNSGGLHDQVMTYEFCSETTALDHNRLNDEIQEGTPSLELDSYSQTSPLGCSPTSLDFVVPSQIVLETFDMHTPLCRTKSFRSETSYPSPRSDYATANEYLGNSVAPSEHLSISPNEMRLVYPTPSRLSPLPYPMFAPLGSSPAPRHLPNSSLPQEQHIKYDRSKRENITQPLRKRIKRDTNDSALPCTVSVQKRAQKPCTFEGCQKKFARQEHLKRHMQTHKQGGLFPCMFCKKPISRSDNLKQHIKAHADPTKNSVRTAHFPEAMKVLQEMSSKPRRSAKALKCPRSRP